MIKKKLFILVLAFLALFLIMSATEIYGNIGSKLGQAIYEMAHEDPLK